MLTKSFLAAAVSAMLLATPVQAASSATALSLSNGLRTGTALEDESSLTGFPVGTWLSLGAIALGLYFSIDALSDDEPVSA
jgi:opacity protein-like surface antigen